MSYQAGLSDGLIKNLGGHRRSRLSCSDRMRRVSGTHIVRFSNEFVVVPNDCGMILEQYAFSLGSRWPKRSEEFAGRLMKETAKHRAKIPRRVIAQIMRDSRYWYSVRELFQGQHETVLTPPVREGHSRIADKKASHSPLGGAGLFAQLRERPIVVRSVSQDLHDPNYTRILAFRHPNHGLLQARHPLDKQLRKPHIGMTGIEIPIEMDRGVKQLAAQRIQIKLNATRSWKVGRHRDICIDGAQRVCSRVGRPMLRVWRNPNCSIGRDDPCARARANCNKALNDRNYLTASMAVRPNLSWPTLIPRESNHRAMGRIGIRKDRQNVWPSTKFHLVTHLASSQKEGEFL